MIPTLSVPNIQVAPPVEVSVFTGQNADAALGRLPVVTVPPTVNSAKVADDNRGQQNQRQANNTPSKPSAGNAAVPFSLSGTGELAFESPYSTTFVAQLFGQFELGEAMADAGSESPLGFVDFDRLSQFDITKYMPSFAFRPQIATPAAETPQETAPAAPAQPSSAPVSTASAGYPAVQQEAPVADLRDMQPVSSDMPVVTATQSQQTAQTASTESLRPSSLIANGVDAYASTQSRNAVNLTVPVPPRDSRGAAQDQVSLIL